MLIKRKVPKSVNAPRENIIGRPRKIRGVPGQRRVATAPIPRSVPRARAVPCHARHVTITGPEVNDPVVVGRVTVEPHSLNIGLGPSAKVIDVYMTVAVVGIRWDGVFDEGVVLPTDVAVRVRQHPSTAVSTQIAVNLEACFSLSGRFVRGV